MAFTYFFRDLYTLQLVRDFVVPNIRSRQHINIWDAGCAIGAEPYSLAMILKENMGQMIFRNVRVYATDIDISNQFGETIRRGVYPQSAIQRIPKDIVNRYFEKDDTNGNFRVIEELRKRISFQKHDLLSLKPFRSGFVLIMCKNVLLHFKPDERIKVIEMFYDVLEEGGYFVTEQTQKLPSKAERLFERVVSNAQLYRKRKAA